METAKARQEIRLFIKIFISWIKTHIKTLRSNRQFQLNGIHNKDINFGDHQENDDDNCWQ